MSYKGLLSQTCTIQTKSSDYTTSGDGQITETWANTYTSVKCRLVSASGDQLEIIRGYNLKSRHVIFLLSSQTVSEGNRIVHDDGDTFLVEFEGPIEGKKALHHKEVYVRLFE